MACGLTAKLLGQPQPPCVGTGLCETMGGVVRTGRVRIFAAGMSCARAQA